MVKPAQKNLVSDDAAPTVRVLVVEDFALFRQSIASILARTDHLQVICEASDGLEAVHKAEELKPDLILLDIGLPTLNGLEAAHRMSQLLPRATILFVSQENDPDVVAEALSNGAKGYVYKQNANKELLPAIEVVLRGDRFVGNWAYR